MKDECLQSLQLYEYQGIGKKALGLGQVAQPRVLNIVGSTSLFSPTTSLLLFARLKLTNILNRQCWTN